MHDKIIHYHIFKNAGSSVDEILKRNFKDKWEEKEFPGIPGVRNHKFVEEWINQTPKLVAHSSHTAMGPLPNYDKGRLISIIFLRHPIDRLKSAYEFERNQPIHRFGPLLAKKVDFKSYCEIRAALPNDTFISNAQTFRLATFVRNADLSPLARAKQAISRFDVVGIVERFEESLGLMQSVLRDNFPNFQAEYVLKNANERSNISLDKRLLEIEREVGRKMWGELLEKNESDLEIHRISMNSLSKIT